MYVEILRSLFLFFIPSAVMFAFERLWLLYLRQRPERVAWVVSQKWLHPNFISRCRYGMGVVSVLLYIYVSKEFAMLWFSFWMISDVTDGTIAKHFNLDTEEGKIIDPLSDKLFYFPPLFYAAYLDLISFYPVLVFLLIDFCGQYIRYFVSEKAANQFGKTKTFLTVLTLVAIYVQYTYFSFYSIELTNALIGGTIFLAFCSTIFKIIPNYWYANILSILNLLCGLTAIGLIWLDFNPLYAIILIFIGQFLDLFDGRAAVKWGSTPRGEIFDDMADGTSFGAAVAILIAATLQYSIIGIALAGLYFVCAVYRLYRFIKDKKKAGVEKGVSVFNGMPTPAAALFICSAFLSISHYSPLIGENISKILLYALVVAISLLMISKIPYLHFGRVILRKIPIRVQVFLYALVVAMIGYSIGHTDSMLLINLTFLISAVYVTAGIRFVQPKT